MFLKTKRDSRGNVEHFKTRLAAEGFTQCEWIDFNDTSLNIIQNY